ncbi:SulP family inorganic anion transporter [Candidatus Rhodobacter oscarellae]|nr:SulP family inorganic anion transporter [Candidatus Rhodobacter lobularis]
MANSDTNTDLDMGDPPKDYVSGLFQNAKFDVMAGFILFLVALPLSLAIAAASGVPAVAGLITAIVGGIIGGFLGGSYVTINGPAAGMIVIVLGCFEAMRELSGGDPTLAYQYLLAVGVVAGLIQILLGAMRAGPMTNVFPFSVVEGMIAGIGIIIMTKQLFVALGVKAPKKMFDSFLAIPDAVVSAAPQAAIIGAIAVALMVYWPKIAGPLAKFIPPPLAIMAVTIPLAAFFNGGAAEPIVALVKVPTDVSAIVTTPNFEMILHSASILFVVSFVMVGSLESLLTAVAIEKKDPWKRRNNMNRELWSKGIANSGAAFIGGIPMIAEVVRSSTNIMVGARTRWSNIFHGSFILLFLVALPFVLNMIPLAALAGMLIVIGFRLAHPSIFKHIAETGKDELVFMIATVLGVVFVDLLFGVFCGMWLSIALNAVRAGNANRFGSGPLFLAVHAVFAVAVFYLFIGLEMKLEAIGLMIVNVVMGVLSFKTGLDVEENGGDVNVKFSGPVVFTSLITVRSALDKLPEGKTVTLDMSAANMVDHTVREKLSDISEEYARGTGGTMEVIGTDRHKPTNDHKLATLVAT